ncbi:MAG: hypothetical protein ACHQEM_11535 [Chitinophagales bacterium]
MQRRNFIRLSAYGGLALSVPFAVGCRHSPTNMAVADPPFLMHIFDKKTMMETGRAYIQQNPDESEIADLENLLIENTPIQATTGSEAVQTYFGNKMKEDFDNDQTVVVDGWVLSKTEARQCALYSLVTHE